MARTHRDGKGKNTLGEITGHLGQVLIGEDGYFARSHNDNVGSAESKRIAKKNVRRARRRLPIKMEH